LSLVYSPSRYQHFSYILQLIIQPLNDEIMLFGLSIGFLGVLLTLFFVPITDYELFFAGGI